MPYYVGDYYMGDYYGGDPGFGSLFKKVGGFIARRIPVVGKLIPRSAPRALPAAAGVASTGMVRRIPEALGEYVKGHPVISAAAAAGTAGVLARISGGGTALPGRTAPPGTRGYHLERRGKHAGQWIRNRRMRVTNPRALRRALRRAYGFEKLAMRTIHLLHPKKKGRFGGFKRKRKARM